MSIRSYAKQYPSNLLQILCVFVHTVGIKQHVKMKAKVLSWIIWLMLKSGKFSHQTIELVGEKRVKFIGLLSNEYTDTDEWIRNLKETGFGKWCINKTAGKIHTPNKGDIIAMRIGKRCKAKIIGYVEVIGQPNINLTDMTEGYDRDIRTARHEGNLNINVSMIKFLDEPIKPKFISKDIKHPNTSGIMKRQTTFKPIDHLYRWTIDNNINNI